MSLYLTKIRTNSHLFCWKYGQNKDKNGEESAEWLLIRQQTGSSLLLPVYCWTIEPFSRQTLLPPALHHPRPRPRGRRRGNGGWGGVGSKQCVESRCRRRGSVSRWRGGGLRQPLADSAPRCMPRQSACTTAYTPANSPRRAWACSARSTSTLLLEKTTVNKFIHFHVSKARVASGRMHENRADSVKQLELWASDSAKRNSKEPRANHEIKSRKKMERKLNHKKISVAKAEKKWQEKPVRWRGPGFNLVLEYSAEKKPDR